MSNQTTAANQAAHHNDYVFVGGGAAAAMTLISLAQKVEDQHLSMTGITLHLFDPDGFGSGGVAYGKAHESHLLNSTRNEMSPWDENEFHEWCINEGLSDNLYEFNLRSDYNRFLQFKTEEAKKILRQAGAHLAIYDTAAHPVPANGTKSLDIFDDAGNIVLKNIPSSHIAVFVGNGPNENFSALQGNPNYVHSVYDTDKVKSLLADNPKADIVYIGAGPALYDAAFTLKSHAGKGSFTVISPHAKPLETRDTSVEEAEASLEPSYLNANTPTTLTELKTLILSDFGDAAKRQGRSNRRVALDTMRHIGKYLQTLDIDLVHAFRQTDTLGQIRHKATPVPKASQDNLARFNPEFIQARLNGNIKALEKGGFEIKIDSRVISPDIIINGTGHGRHNSPFWQTLKALGHVEVDSYLGTLKTEEQGHRLAKSGLLHAGQATNFGIDGIETFYPAANNIADEITRTLSIRQTVNNLGQSTNQTYKGMHINHT